ncbi:DUF1048 domain-containing protein [Clostridium tagluense]|uniref:DUF1048 domain-containing protein n=1 Tax=Clostridium tagluense TaxID=360422 RepID=UPI001C0C684A|nr:DUF1048 domain-containing protein [Clostridium tagluense]MBU3129284.1 DUF1048 domain-containing protein [Clostridium tagluense]
MVRVMILQFKKNKLKKELNERDLKNFEDIVQYIEISPLSSIEREEVFQQVLDMMLQAKNEGKFASEVIGDDIKGFCDSIIEESSYNKSAFNICFNYIESFFQVGFIGFVMVFIISIVLGDGNFKRLDLLSIELFMYMGLVTVIPQLIKRRKIFNKKKNKIDYYWVFLFICVYLFLSLADVIKDKLPQLAIIKIPYVNKIFLLMVFLIAFGREIFYFIKNISTKCCKK